jgi:hypothetical protein
VLRHTCSRWSCCGYCSYSCTCPVISCLKLLPQQLQLCLLRLQLLLSVCQRSSCSMCVCLLLQIMTS